MLGRVFDISAYPTFIVFRGAEKARWPGAREPHERCLELAPTGADLPPLARARRMQLGETTGADLKRVEELLKKHGAKEAR